MTRNPLVNSCLAILYIVVVSSILYSGTIFKVGANSVIAPIALLSLFSFSAAMMAFLSGYQPFVLYLEGKQKAALDLLLHTFLFFGGFTLVALVVLFSRVLKIW